MRFVTRISLIAPSRILTFDLVNDLLRRCGPTGRFGPDLSPQVIEQARHARWPLGAHVRGICKAASTRQPGAPSLISMPWNGTWRSPRARAVDSHFGDLVIVSKQLNTAGV